MTECQTSIAGLSPHCSPAESSARGEEVKETERTADVPEPVDKKPDVQEFELVAPVRSVVTNQRSNRGRSRVSLVKGLIREAVLSVGQIHPRNLPDLQQRRREKLRALMFMQTSQMLLQKLSRDL
ncbi:uncharacterized protein PAE49_012373 [Odontesthes bonariensis]